LFPNDTSRAFASACAVAPSSSATTFEKRTIAEPCGPPVAWIPNGLPESTAPSRLISAAPAPPLASADTAALPLPATAESYTEARALFRTCRPTPFRANRTRVSVAVLGVAALPEEAHPRAVVEHRRSRRTGGRPPRAEDDA
jgi:hypothetical protein